MPADLRRFVAAAVVVMGLAAAACGGSSTESAGPTPPTSTDQGATPVPTTAPAAAPTTAPASDTPGGFDFDRSDPVAGVANIVAAFATDEATATCIYEAWGDVANVPAGQLTPELMNFPICGTSIFQLMTGDPRFTGRTDDG